MRIAFIVGLFPALSATFIQNQVTGLLDQGFDIQIFAGENPKETKVHPDVLKYRLSERVYYFSIPLNKMSRMLKGGALFLKYFFKEPRIILRSLNIIKYGKEALSLNLFYHVIPFLNKGNRFDIIHCHFGPNGIIGSYLKELGIKGKIITTFYGYDLSSYFREEGSTGYKKLFFNGDLFFPICSYFKQILIDKGCDAEKIRVHPIGIDLKKYAIKEIKNEYHDTINVLSIGRLCEKKGIEYGIRAIASLSDKFRNIRYLIAGDGELYKKLFSLAEELNIQKIVKFVGQVDQEELVSLYTKAHIFLLPSITADDGDQEGTPTVLLEAQAMGLPVISSIHSGIPEIILDGKSGFMVPEKDVDALVEHLNILITSPGLRAEFGKKGRAFIEENFDIQVLNRKLAQYYL